MKTNWKRTIALALALALICGAAQAEVRTTGNVNLRTGPGLDYDTVASVPEGTELEYLGQTSVDERGVAWYRVEHDGPCWISSKYSELDEDEVQDYVTADGDADENGDIPDEIIPYDAEAAADYIDASEYYLANLDESAEELELTDYEEVVSESPRRYSDGALTLGGMNLVEYIGLRGAGYTIFGAAIGMTAEEASAALEEAGMAPLGGGGDSLSFEHPANEESLIDVEGFDSCINLWCANGLVYEIDWSSYTG